MQFDYLIKNGTLVTDDAVFKADIGIIDETIAAIDSNIVAVAKRTIDATGKYLFPGGIDVHTHLDMPLGNMVTKDDFVSGTIAAAHGGTTTIIDFCTQTKGQSLQDALALWHHKADGKSCIDYGFHLAITDVTDAILQEIPQVISQGYPSFKLYMTYDALRVEDDALLATLVQVGKYDGLVSVHAENHYVIKYLTAQFKKEGKSSPLYHALSRPALAEAEAVSRAIKLAMIAKTAIYIVHVSSAVALQEITAARQRGAVVLAETCPQYLLLSEDDCRATEFHGAKYVISPPLRTAHDQKSLWQGLHAGDLQVIATDHCALDFIGQKDRGRNFFGDIPGGMAGIELRMMLLFDRGVNGGHISLQQFVALTATNPAKIFGLSHRKGAIAVGKDADLVIFDPTLKTVFTKLRTNLSHEKYVVHENVDYTPYEGFEVTGRPIMTFCRGEIVMENNKFVGKVGFGKFVKRQNLKKYLK